MRTCFIATSCLAFLPVASADPLLEMMRGFDADGPLYSYEMEVDQGGVVAIGKIDPSQPEGSRITVYSPVEEDWPDGFADGLKEMEAETDGDIWCADFADLVPENAVLQSQTEEQATYAFTPQPDADADSNERKMMKKLKGQITLDKSDGAVLAYSMSAPKPFKPAMVAKINQFAMDVACTRAPDGRTYVQDFSLNIKGSAMMQSFEESVRRKITALLDPVG